MWKDITGYEGLYQVSDKGEIRRFYKGGGTKEVKNRDGLYYTVSLSMKCEKRTYAVHRLVAEMFIPRPVWCTEVNHKDGNKHNNCVENLEWVTQQENQQHAIDVLGKRPFGKAPRPVKATNKKTGEVKEYPSISAAAKDFGKPLVQGRVAITSVCIGTRKSAYGYRWEYIN